MIIIAYTRTEHRDDAILFSGYWAAWHVKICICYGIGNTNPALLALAIGNFSLADAVASRIVEQIDVSSIPAVRTSRTQGI